MARPAADHHPDSRHEQAEAHAPRPFLGRTRKAFSFLLATETWKRSTKNVVHRASFPLLRSVLKSSARSAKETFHPFSEISTKDLERSLKAHSLFLILAIPASLFVLFSLTRGLAAIIKYGTVTTWLLYSIPLSIYLAAKAYVSYNSRSFIVKELEQRNKMEGSK